MDELAKAKEGHAEQHEKITVQGRTCAVHDIDHNHGGGGEMRVVVESEFPSLCTLQELEEEVQELRRREFAVKEAAKEAAAEEDDEEEVQEEGRRRSFLIPHLLLQHLHVR